MAINQPGTGFRLPDAHADLHQAWIFFFAQGLIVTLLGLAAIAAPIAASMVADLFIGWLFLASGAIGLFTVFRTKRAHGTFWVGVASILSVLAGALLLWRPAEGVLTLAVILAGFFIAEGVVQTVLALQYRSLITSGWAWLLLSGLCDFILAGFIISGWPDTGAWVLGLIVGINLVTSGVSIVMVSFAVRDLDRLLV